MKKYDEIWLCLKNGCISAKWCRETDEGYPLIFLTRNLSQSIPMFWMGWEWRSVYSENPRCSSTLDGRNMTQFGQNRHWGAREWCFSSNEWSPWWKRPGCDRCIPQFPQWTVIIFWQLSPDNVISLKAVSERMCPRRHLTYTIHHQSSSDGGSPDQIYGGYQGDIDPLIFPHWTYQQYSTIAIFHGGEMFNMYQSVDPHLFPSIILYVAQQNRCLLLPAGLYSGAGRKCVFEARGSNFCVNLGFLNQSLFSLWG